MGKHLKPHPWKTQPFGKKAEPKPFVPKDLFVEVVESATEVVVKRLGPYSNENEAEKADRGANINLNHERFFTRTTAA